MDGPTNGKSPMWFVKNKQKANKINFFFLTLVLFFTTLLTLRSFKRINIQDLSVHGSELFSKEDIVKNSSLNLGTRLIFIKTRYLEKELSQNLSLEKISVRRQILPFGLKILIKTRTPTAYGERFLNGNKISGFIDKNGFFINKEYADKQYLSNLEINVYGWKENFKKTLSKILSSQDNFEFELVEVSFSQNGFVTIKEKDLKTIFLGFNPNLIESQLQIINSLKSQLKKNLFSEEIDNIDLTDPNNPKIKVFKR